MRHHIQQTITYDDTCQRNIATLSCSCGRVWQCEHDHVTMTLERLNHKVVELEHKVEQLENEKNGNK